ncbi:hypothetical protein L596_013236 [Steinernema carpocapsae]|uniref:Uncharacterized protein n=1 Tax=Steinernema carpocapsae TaxID=34508 RepID=A0A4U5P018_STECR|nr:hypothetical protein L596_013236 [Steinernema carpocapsae]
MTSGRPLRFALTLLALPLVFAENVTENTTSESRISEWLPMSWRVEDQEVTVNGTFRYFPSVKLAKEKLEKEKLDWCPMAMKIQQKKDGLDIMNDWKDSERQEFTFLIKNDSCHKREIPPTTTLRPTTTIDPNDDPSAVKKERTLWICLILVCFVIKIPMTIWGIIELCKMDALQKRELKEGKKKSKNDRPSGGEMRFA